MPANHLSICLAIINNAIMCVPYTEQLLLILGLCHSTYRVGNIINSEFLQGFSVSSAAKGVRQPRHLGSVFDHA